MSQYKVCVYAICKNEAQFVDRWMDAVQEADLVVVTDTGSTDDTVEKLRARGATVYEETIRPWRFDTARNRALDHLPEDADICVSNDLDEVFEPGWRAKLEDAWHPEHTRAKYWFAWSHHEDGSVHKRYHMEKIHRRHGFRWVRPVHEILSYTGEDPDNSVFIDDLILHHYPDAEKSRGQYLPLLELSVKENPEDDRAMFWLGREYLYARSYDQAIQTFARHLALDCAKWPEERGASAYYTAQAYQHKGDMEAAKAWLFRAVSECAHTREPWLAMARFGYTREDWPLTYFSVKQGLAIREKTNSYLTDPLAWGYLFYDLGAIACYRLGLMDEALTLGTQALQQKPGDPRLKRNLELIIEKHGSR